MATAASMPKADEILPTRPAGRVGSLDSLRGIAAVMVLTFHCSKIGVLAEPSGWAVYLWRWTPLNWLVTGRPWVILFFVLSGFVLSLAIDRAGAAKGRGAAGFVMRRICRIYLPFAFAILFSALAWMILQPEPIAGLSNWFNGLAWTDRPTPTLLAQHLLMTGIEGQDSLNPVMWSLVYELRISIFFPLLWIAVWRWSWATLIAALLLHLAAGILAGCAGRADCGPYRGRDLVESFVLTGYFTVFFVIGMLIARYRSVIIQGLKGGPGGCITLLSIAAIYAVILPHVPRFTPLLPADASFGLGAGLMIALALGSSTWSRVLHAPPLLWLGRISYSLYLTHNIVLLAVVHLLYPQLDGLPLVATVVIASLLVAEISYRMVEAPSIRLGRLFSRGASAVNHVAGGHA